VAKYIIYFFGVTVSVFSFSLTLEGQYTPRAMSVAD